MIIAKASQFHVYLSWGQCPFGAFSVIVQPRRLIVCSTNVNTVVSTRARVWRCSDDCHISAHEERLCSVEINIQIFWTNQQHMSPVPSLSPPWLNILVRRGASTCWFVFLETLIVHLRLRNKNNNIWEVYEAMKHRSYKKQTWSL